jgi:hypothetical protein
MSLTLAMGDGPPNVSNRIKTTVASRFCEVDGRYQCCIPGCSLTVTPIENTLAEP